MSGTAPSHQVIGQNHSYTFQESHYVHTACNLHLILFTTTMSAYYSNIGSSSQSSTRSSSAASASKFAAASSYSRMLVEVPISADKSSNLQTAEPKYTSTTSGTGSSKSWEKPIVHNHSTAYRDETRRSKYHDVYHYP